MKKNYFLIGLILLLFIPLLFYLNKNYTETKTMFYMDSVITVKVTGKSKASLKKVLDEVDLIYETYHKLTDRFNEYPEINNIYYINNHPDEWIKVEKNLLDLIEYGKLAYEISFGKFNIALGSVIDEWRSYRLSGEGVPSFNELKEKDKYTSIQNILINKEESSVLIKKGTKIDLGGIAKGYVTEVVSKYLENNGFSNYLINAGGNIKVGLGPRKNNTWRVGIEEPVKDDRGIYKILNVKNVAVVTSGGYERFYEYDGKIYHHIINPDTLYPSKYMKSVTIITPDSAYADILSTTLFNMSVEEGMEFIKMCDDVEAIWYVDKDNIYYSEGIDKYE